jgi:drug/metabolite transporter (DMT)-like permease
MGLSIAVFHSRIRGGKESCYMDTAAIKLKTNSQQFTRGYLICLGATISWAFTGIIIRYLNVKFGLPALVLAYWRDLFVTLGLLLALAITHPARLRLPSGQFKFLAVYGMVLAFFNTLWTFSVALNGAAVSTVLAYSSAAFTAILGWWLLNESLGKVKLFAVALGFTGCVFVSGAYDLSVWRLNPFGILTGILTGLLFAGYSLLGRASSNRSINPWTALVYTFSFAAILLLGMNLASGWITETPPGAQLLWLGRSTLGWGILLLLALGPTIGGFGLYSLSLTLLPASVANLIAMLEPALTAVMAYLLLGERLNGMQWLGSLCIIGCVLIVRLNENLRVVIASA